MTDDAEHASDRQRLEALLDAHVDGALDAAGAAELQRLLADPALRRGLHGYAVLHGGLREALADPRIAPGRSGAGAAPRRRWSPPLLIAAALAGVLVGAAILSLRTGRPSVARPSLRSPGPGALVIHDGATVTPVDGLRLLPGDHVRGATELAWDDGTTLASEPGTEFEVLRSPSIALSLFHGSVRMDVRPQPAGMPLMISTDQGTATVVGTRFAMTASADETRLAVEHGAIDFRSIDGSPAQRVFAGGQAVSTGRGVPTSAPLGAGLGTPVQVELDAVAERGAGWSGQIVPTGVRAVRTATGWACGTRTAQPGGALIASGEGLRIDATCSSVRGGQIGILVVINDPRTGRFLCNRQVIRAIAPGAPATISCTWSDLAYATGPVRGPESALQGQGISQVLLFGWDADPGLVLQRVVLSAGGR